jgi:hypothetical protein
MSPPLRTPYFLTASAVYSEQVGQYLQEGGTKGETKRRYTPIAAPTIRRALICTPSYTPSSSPTLLLLSLRRAFRNSSFNSLNEASAAAGRAETTKSRSTGSLAEEERKISLNLLRTALRFTAVPTFLETDKPNLGLPTEFGKAWTEKSLPL